MSALFPPDPLDAPLTRKLAEAGFDVLARNHADAILSVDFPTESAELFAALSAFRVSVAEIVAGGGGESGQTQRLRRELATLGWPKHVFTVQTVVNGEARESASHEIDHVRRGAAGTLALEIEWNNKDPFFDRDLENFQRLHAQSAISVGIVVTRGISLQRRLVPLVRRFVEARGIGSADGLAPLGIRRRTERQSAALARLTARGVPFAEAFAKLFVADKFGAATTHWSKLEERLRRGVGNPCPLLLVGLPAAAIVEDHSAARLREV